MYHVWERVQLHTGFWWGYLMRRDHLELPGLDGRIILKLIFKKLDGNMDCVDVAQDRDSRWTVVNAVMNLWVP